MAGIGEDLGAFAAAGAMEAAALGLNKLTAKATLYVRITGLNLDTTGAKVNDDTSGLRTLLKKRNKGANKIFKRAGSSVTAADIVASATEGKIAEAQLALALLQKGFIPIEVQYNPSSINLNSVGGPIKKYNAMGNDNMNSFTSVDKKTATYLTTQLIFEDINVSDAFGASSLSINASSAVDNVKSLVKNLSGGYSVKKQVEGLVSLLMTKETRQVIFVWNDMFFHGELLYVDVAFNMFNKNGHPIKATADIKIIQNNTNASYASDKQYWNDAIDYAFKTPLF